jgi:hypothetical protein
VLPGVKDFLDYMRSIATSAIDLLPISNPSEISRVAEQIVAEQVSISSPISNPPEISRVAEQIVAEQVSISSPISNPPEISRVAEQIVTENTPLLFEEQGGNSRKCMKKSKKKS